jgi:hypothetical protein
MPPKTTSLPQIPKPKGPSKEELDAINEYLSRKLDFEKLIAEEQPIQAGSATVKPLTEYDRKLNEAVKESLEAVRKQAKPSATKS